MRKGNPMKLEHGTLIALVAAAAIGAIPAAATAATYEAGDATCYTSSIFAKPPVLHPTGATSTASTTTWGGTEKVAFQANLAKWTGSSWSTVQSGRWKAQYVPRFNDYSVAYSGLPFYDAVTNASVYGTTIFTITTSGYFRVFYRMYWYATGESRSSWADHLDERTNNWDLGTHPWCQY